MHRASFKFAICVETSKMHARSVAQPFPPPSFDGDQVIREKLEISGRSPGSRGERSEPSRTHHSTTIKSPGIPQDLRSDQSSSTSTLTGRSGVEPRSSLSSISSSEPSSSLFDGVLSPASDSLASWPGGPSLRGDLRRGSPSSTWLVLGADYTIKPTL